MSQRTEQAEAAQFAALTDALMQGQEPQTLADVFAGELRLARQLRVTAGGAMPDPAFVDDLRRQLQLRVEGRTERAEAEIVHWATTETDLGRLFLAYRAGKVVYCERAVSEAAFERRVAAVLGSSPQRDSILPAVIERDVRDHLSGRRRFTAVDISWLPPFQQRVLAKTAEIPRGEVRPYGWVARELGSPGAVRAVGTALGKNPVPFLIPCHRVVRSDGSLGEYSGGGPAMKVAVLESEGAPVGELLRGATSGERFRGSRTTHIVCYPSCHAARRIRPDNAAPFGTIAAAQASGYRPCQLCRPA